MDAVVGGVSLALGLASSVISLSKAAKGLCKRIWLPQRNKGRVSLFMTQVDELSQTLESKGSTSDEVASFKSELQVVKSELESVDTHRPFVQRLFTASADKAKLQKVQTKLEYLEPRVHLVKDGSSSLFLSTFRWLLSNFSCFF